MPPPASEADAEAAERAGEGEGEGEGEGSVRVGGLRCRGLRVRLSLEECPHGDSPAVAAAPEVTATVPADADVTLHAALQVSP